MRAVEVLKAAGLVVWDAGCLVDREAGGREALTNVGVRLHSLFTLDDFVSKAALRGGDEICPPLD